MLRAAEEMSLSNELSLLQQVKSQEVESLKKQIVDLIEKHGIETKAHPGMLCYLLFVLVRR